MKITFEIPLRTVSGLNAREHWRVKARRVATERRVTGIAFLVHVGQRWPKFVPGTVWLSRRGIRELDSDNHQGALKAVRDQIAACLGVDDGPGSPVRFEYGPQARGPYAVLVTLESAAEAA